MALLLTRRYLLALVPATVAAALAIGIPTDVLPNPWFTRMTPVRALDVVLWPLTSLAAGAVVATWALSRSRRPVRYRRPRRAAARRSPGVLGRGSGASSSVGAGAGGGLLGLFAVGCPICNKLVVLALGVSGALTYFEPVRPVLGVLSIVLSLAFLRFRVRALAQGCPIDVRRSAAPAGGDARRLCRG